MKLYEIDRELEAALESLELDEETGEIVGGFEAIEALNMEREAKIEGVLLGIKNGMAEAAAIRAEEIALAKRRKAIEGKLDRTREWLREYLSGEKFKTAKVSVTYRTAQKTECSADFVEWALEHEPELLRYREPEPDKTEIGKLLKAGVKVYGCELVDNTSMIIK